MKAALIGLALALVAGGAIVLLRPLQTERTDHGDAKPAGGGGEERGASAPKALFMRSFVAALAAPPKNLVPQPAYAPLFKEGATLKCADCHASKDYDTRFAEDPDVDPQPFRMDRKDFMIPLMEKWVARLNKRHRERLVKEVVCTDCHAADPRDDAARTAAFAPLMEVFVNALTEPPANKNPAKAWKPLLKPGETVSCAVCHGEGMKLPAAPLSASPPSDRLLMIRLMERWVHELNRRMKGQLVKAVGCIDCHEVDPRK